MGVSTTITVTCDYSGCRVANKGPAMVSWNKELADSGKVEPPEESKYLILFNQNGVLKSFCCQLHAAEYFLPPGYEAKQKQVIEMPRKDPKPTETQEAPAQSWMDLPQRIENPDNGQEEK